MNGITHKQAQKYVRLDLDGLLTDDQRRDLETHLSGCEACRLDAQAFSTLTSRLQSGFRSRWDAQNGPSKNVMATVRSQTRRIIMSTKVNWGLRTLGGIAVLFLLGFGLNIVFSRLRDNSIAANETAIPDNNMPVSTQAEKRLLAFTKEVDGNLDVYTIRADGTGLTNLTNDPARDASPVWSPDGKYIAFESDRTGISQIYLMYANGSNIVQLTDDNAEHHLFLTGDGRLDLWSPDGNKLLFVKNDLESKTNNLYSVNINSKEKIFLASDARRLDSASWSPNGEYVGYVVWDEVEPGGFVPDLYIVDSAGNRPEELSKILPQDEHVFEPYFWASDGRSIIFPGTLYAKNRETIYQFDPQENTLNPLMVTKPMLYDWYEGVALFIDGEKENQLLVWQRPDGSSAELDTLKGRGPADCYISKARSLQGNLVIGSYCRNDGKVYLYWTNKDGSAIQPLPNVEVPVLDGGLTSLTLSPDERFLTFNFGSENETSLYIWDVEAALKDPSIQPMKVLAGNSKFHFTPSWQPVLIDEVVEQKPAPTANERRVAFTMEKDGNLDIYTIRADGTDLTNLTNSPEQEDNPYWSPDGKHIAFNGIIDGQQQIFMMDADGSNAVQLTDDDGMHNKLVSFEEGREAGFDAWSPDGKKLVFVKIDFNLASIGGWMKLYVLDIETKTQTPLTSEWGLYQSPAWSPDGEHVAFTSMTINEQGEPEHISVQVANADGSGLVDLTGSLPDGEFPSMSLSYWSHDGQSVFFISRMITGDSNKVYEARLDGNLIEHAMGTGIQDWWNGTTLLQTNSRLDWLHEDGTQFTLSTCGTRFASRRSSIGDLFFGIYCPGTDWRLYLANEDGSQVNQILEAPITFTGGGLTAAWSPDNQFVAFNLSSQYKTEMYILNMTDTLNDPSIRPFSIDVGDVFSFGDSLSWQPVMAEQDQVVEEKPASVGGDRLLAFTKEVDGNFEIFTVRADGTGLTNLTNDPAKDDNPYWSPDGKRIAFNSNRDVNTHNTQVYVMDADGSNVTLLTGGSLSHMLVGFLDGRGDGLGFSPWSPDGSKILLIEKNFSSNTQTLQVLDLATGKQTQLTENSSFTIPSWAPDGQHIAFMTIKDSQSEINHIYVVDLDGNNLVDVTGSLKETEFAGFNYEWSSDGESISFLAGDTANNSDTVYEADLHGVLTEKARSNFKNGLALYWRNGVTMMLTAASSVGWLQSDGTRSELEFCPGEDGRRLNLRESTQGDWIAGMLCPNNEWKVYWANPDGTQTQKILNVSIPAGEDTRFVDLAWSQDDRFVAFNITTGNTAEMYIVDIAETLTDPMVQPEKFDAGKVFDIQGSPVDSLSWQPMPTDRLVELNRTPEPTPTPRNLGLIAFTSAMENDNLDIYTMYPDGSGLTDLTNDPAHDVNPYWSLDGKRIAFMSDRTGFMQIFVMNADGSDVIQLTDNEANHEFGVSDHSPWSPDGSRLLFTEWAASNEKWMLYTVDMNGENKTPIAEVPNVYTSPSWSLDGQHIAYIVTETVENREVARIHVVGADGTNDTNVTSMLPKDVDLSSWLYSWTPEGNIRFAANRVYVENDSLDFTVYEVTMDGATLAELAHTSTGPGDIWNGTTFVAGTSTLNWLRSDGSYREYQPFEKCQMGSDPQYGYIYKRSSHGYLIFAANCPNGDWWFTWADPQSNQVQQLLNYPISTQQGISNITWSSDDKYVAISLYSSDVTYLYVINVDAALKDPSIQPLIIPLAGGEQYYNISWQPIP